MFAVEAIAVERGRRWSHAHPVGPPAADTAGRIRIHATKLGLVTGVGYYLQLAEIEVY